MALVGMKVHLAIGQRPDQLAVLTDVGDQHHRRIAGGETPCVTDGRRPKPLPEANLVILAQMLIPQQDDERLVPNVLDLREELIVERLAQVNPEDLRADCGRERSGPYILGARSRARAAG
jgi:hypothetical protein